MCKTHPLREDLYTRLFLGPLVPVGWRLRTDFHVCKDREERASHPEYRHARTQEKVTGLQRETQSTESLQCSLLVFCICPAQTTSLLISPVNKQALIVNLLSIQFSEGVGNF